MVASRAAGAGSRTLAAPLVLYFYSAPFDAANGEVVRRVGNSFRNISMQIGDKITLQQNREQGFHCRTFACFAPQNNLCTLTNFVFSLGSKPSGEGTHQI
jgi:hypothetical protein